MKRLFLVSLIVCLIAFMPSLTVHASVTSSCDKLQIALNKFRLKNKISGMGLYVSSSHGKSSSCYLFSGYTDRVGPTRISQHNLFQIGSITKSYFSAILLQLEADSETGKIPVKFNINQKISQWLPQYPDWGNVTIKQLLNMTGGIYSYTELPNLTHMVLENPKKIWTADEITRLAYKHKPNTYFSPGKGWHYSDTDYVIVGQLIQKIYQQSTGHRVSLQAILKKFVFDKLKLNNTYYYPTGLPDKLASRMVHGYEYYTKKDVTSFNLSTAGPSGAIISNPKEVADWIIGLFTGKVLPKKQLKEMQSLVSTKTGHPVAVHETASVPGYSLGLLEQYSNKQGPIWTYLGDTFGYTAVYYYLPKQHTIISFTASIGSIKPNPIQFVHFAKTVCKLYCYTTNQ